MNLGTALSIMESEKVSNKGRVIIFIGAYIFAFVLAVAISYLFKPPLVEITDIIISALLLPLFLFLIGLVDKISSNSTEIKGD